MSDKPSGKMHQRCKHCGAVVETRASKSFKCPSCGERTRIHHVRALKPQRVPHYFKTDLNQFRVKPEP